MKIKKPQIESGVSIDLGGSQYTRQDELFINSSRFWRDTSLWRYFDNNS